MAFLVDSTTNLSGFGRSPTGRAMRYNAFLPQAQHKKTFSLLSLTQKQENLYASIENKKALIIL
jgi:hypothetical protein